MIERRIRPFLKAIAAMALIAALSGVQSARALDQELQITVDGFSTTYTAPNGASATTGGNVTFHGVLINANISDNNPGTSSESFIQGATVSLRYVSGASHSVVISVGDTNWTAPQTPPSIVAVSSLGGTSTNGGASGLSLTGYVDPGNGQNSTPAVYSLGPVSAYQTANTIGSGGGKSFALNDVSTLITVLTTKFSMTSVVDVTVGSGTVVNFTSNLVLTPTPEPSSMAIAGLGALGMIGYGLRRRKALGA